MSARRGKRKLLGSLDVLKRVRCREKRVGPSRNPEQVGVAAGTVRASLVQGAKDFLDRACCQRDTHQSGVARRRRRNNAVASDEEILNPPNARPGIADGGAVVLLAHPDGTFVVA